MKQKKLLTYLIVTAVVGVALLVFLVKTGIFTLDNAFQLVTLPFLPVYRWLAHLSEGGGLRSGLGVMLWVLVSLLPLIPAVLIRGNKETWAERIAWAAASVFLFLALFNEFHLLRNKATITGDMEQYLYCLLVWTLIITAVVLHVIRLFSKGDTLSLYRYLRIFLVILSFFAVIKMVLGLLTSGLLGTFISGTGFNGYTLCSQILMFLLTAVPGIMEILVIFSALNMLDNVLSEEQDGIREASKKLSAVCCRTLAVTVIFCCIVNFLLFFFIGKSTEINISLNLPFTQLLFVLMALLFSRLATENRELKDDNSLFI